VLDQDRDRAQPQPDRAPRPGRGRQPGLLGLARSAAWALRNR
jgi:hypothetical protein